jgi:hypothetical protein
MLFAVNVSMLVSFVDLRADAAALPAAGCCDAAFASDPVAQHIAHGDRHS